MKEFQEECPRVKSFRLDVLKYQLHILYIGLIIEDSHPAYSKEVNTYLAEEIFEHLVETAIPLYIDLKKKGKLPTVAPLKLSCLPNLAMLRNMSGLGNNIYKQTKIEQVRMRKEAQYERDKIEERGEGHR